MAHMAEVKFSDLQTDERYKRLERTLKLALLKKGRKQDGDVSWSSIMSPSISSINADAFDSSTNVPFLQASRIGSEVVSSSNNLKNILLKGKDTKSDHKRTATSSIKKFNKDADPREDQFMMPPPNCDRILSTFKKSNSVAHNIAKAGPVPEIDCTASDIDKESPKESALRYLQNSSNTVQNKKIRIFTRWKVVLNEQGQLIIRGMIECGQIARSKPIIRRLTITTVQSISKHVYYLQGDIVDDGYELPDFVRGKFHSGFPDDWENVYQIWRTFVQQGSKLTFRWPTPIADSDDDLKSEVTDITYASLSSPEDKTLKFKTSNGMRASRLSFNSDCTFNVSQSNSGKENRSPRSGRISNLSTQTRMSNASSKLCDNVAVQTPAKQCSCEKESYKQQESIASSCSYLGNKTNKLKDKLNGIVDNLDKNCPEEFMNKIIEIFDCLNYVMSHGPIKDDESNTEGSKLEQNKCTVQDQRNEANDNSREYCQSELIPLQNPLHLDIDKHSCSIKTDRTITGNKFIGANRDKDDDDDSGSEIYAGVPRISAERVLRQKETLTKPCKRKVRKQLMHQKHNITGNKYTPNVSRDKSFSDASRIANVNSMKFNDSSVSIIGDETECLRVKKFINNTNDEDNVSKHSNFNEIEEGEREKRNSFKRDERTHEMQEHIVQKHSTKHYRSGGTICDSFKASENNECKINGTTGMRNDVADTNSRTEIFKNRDGNFNHQHQDYVIEEQPEQLLAQPMDAGKKISKPVLISSVAVSVDIMRKQGLKVDVVEKDNNKELKKPNEDVKSLKQKESPLKKPNSIRISNPVPLIHKKQDHEAHNNVQVGNVNSPISKKWRQDELRVAIDDQDENDCKSKLLSAWVPRLLQKPELCLIFVGKLLNDAGHVVHRNFKTGPVMRRVSSKLIETVNHEFYELIGDINDTKHAIPKELLHQCRYGCPSRIETFCRTWKSLRRDDDHSRVTTVKLNDTVDAINIGVSSKGRRIIPPLSYWTGERIALKDNNPVYSPGISQDSLLTTSCECRSNSKPLQKTNRSKKNDSDESKNTPVSGAENSTKDLKKIGRNKHGNFVTRKKRRAVEQAVESSDSSDNKNIPASKKQKVKGNQRGSPNSADTENKQDAEAKVITKPTQPTVRANGDFNTSKEM
ncbi:uncharacterized protein LOC143369534 isoform X2 [Andrena cerasifolii]